MHEGWNGPLALGKEHSDTLNSMNNLVLVLHDQCQYEEREKIFVMAAIGVLRVLGSKPPNSLRYRDNLLSIWESPGIEEKGTKEDLLEIFRGALNGNTLSFRAGVDVRRYRTG